MISATPDLSSEPSSVQPRRRDDVVAALFRELGVVGLAQHHRRIVGQHEIAAVVVRVDDRAHVGAADLGRRVDVRDEPDDGHLFLARRRGNRRHDVAVLIDRRVGDAHLLQLVDELIQAAPAVSAVLG